jgi:A/G-specific adenine glycosylase
MGRHARDREAVAALAVRRRTPAEAARSADAAEVGADAAELRRRLLAWYRANRRDLPWRRTRDPWAILVSELMLQQTRVDTVIPYYERFLARFPDAASLARAPLDDVLSLWAGLGYYGRARNLHRAADQIVREHAGALPDGRDALRALPGVGRYTAGAVASIAFGRAEPVVDGNVTRVLARLRGIRADVGSPAVIRRLWQEAEALARGRSPGELNQGLMELGATVCTPRAPRCSACPWQSRCRACRDGNAESLPVKSRKTAPREVEAVAGVVERRGRWLVVRRPPAGLLGGLWELPGGDCRPGEAPAAALARCLRERVGLAIRGAEAHGHVAHAFTHLRLRLHVFRCDAGPGRVARAGFDAHRWLPHAGIGALPVGGPTRKALALLRGSA